MMLESIIFQIYHYLQLPMSQKVRQTLVNLQQGDSNVYDHVKNLVVKLASDQQSIHSFQKYSFDLKGGAKDNSTINIKQSYKLVQQFQNKNRTLLGKLNTGTQEQPQEPASLGYQPDLLEQSQKFAQFGVGIGEDQAYRVFKSLCKLSLKRSTKQVKFWGKILSKEKDYYIAQGLADGGQEGGELPPDVEAKGTGVNKMNYWATTQLTGEWTQLPIVSPSQIITSRKIKYIFTGDLKRSILTNPIFIGTQAHLLKCQIIRINTSCSIIPKGYLIENEEKEIVQPQEYTFPSVSYLSQKQNWVYSNVSVLKCGRTTLIKPEGLEEEQAKKWDQQMNKKDPSEPRLKNVTLDSEVWGLKGINVDSCFKSMGRQPKTVSKGVVGVKNLVWPGWLTIGYEGKFSSVYVGYGHKSKNQYYPSEPQNILEEAEDRTQVVINE